MPPNRRSVMLAAEVICVVYTGDMDVTPSELLLQVRLQWRYMEIEVHLL